MSEESTKLAEEVDLSIIRYAQCWEDADVLLEALQIRPGDVCLSITSAGDNTLSLLTQDPERVIAVDLSEAQTACLELRVAGYRELSYEELLELMGARPSVRREQLYRRLAPALSETARAVWDRQSGWLERGIGRAGRFERYLDIIRRTVVNLSHARRQRESLMTSRSQRERAEFYRKVWNNRRWRLLLKLLCSRFLMGRIGRDPRFFKYAQGSVADHIMGMVEHALVDLDPEANPYLHWMVLGDYGDHLPHALRQGNVEKIRQNLDRLEWHVGGLYDYLEATNGQSVHRFNLSDVFEYLSEDASARVFRQIARTGCPGGRLAYWNMLVPRHCPETLADRIRALPEESRRLHEEAKTFFYRDFVVEEIV